MTTLQKIRTLNWFDFLRKIKDILTNLNSSSFEEAPIDGNQYARQDGDWSEVTGGGDVSSGIYTPTITGGAGFSPVIVGQTTYTLIDKIVTVNVQLNCNPNITPGTSITVGISLPLPADGSVYNYEATVGSGTLFQNGYTANPLRVFKEVDVNNRVELSSFSLSNGGLHKLGAIFSYITV